MPFTLVWLEESPGQRLGDRRQFDKHPVRSKNAVGGEYVHVRMEENNIQSYAFIMLA